MEEEANPGKKAKKGDIGVKSAAAACRRQQPA
jgi:hypothetical protein